MHVQLRCHNNVRTDFTILRRRTSPVDFVYLNYFSLIHMELFYGCLWYRTDIMNMYKCVVIVYCEKKKDYIDDCICNECK